MNALNVYKMLQSANSSLQFDPVASVPIKEIFLKDYTLFTMCDVGGRTCMAAYDSISGSLDFFDILSSSPWARLAGAIDVGKGWSILEFFTLANDTYAMLYESKVGHLAFFSVSKELKSTQKFNYWRAHAPAATHGFTTLKPFVLANGIVLLGYSFDSGQMSMYTVASTSKSDVGAAPLQARVAGDFQWANGWTRFAFFQYGGENFFLKTNITYPNVNIDHVLDNPTTGTSEVATRMTLKDALVLKFVVPFTFAYFDPYFLAYKEDGTTTCYRIHADCNGWTEVGNAMLPPTASSITIATLGQEKFCIVI